MSTFPAFYDPSRIGSLFYPDTARIAEQAETAGLQPAAGDSRNVQLVLVDMQVDFCHESGALHVPGAREDIRRVIEFIYRNAGRITRITCSLDSHLPAQIFSPTWWVDEQGDHPPPFTLIGTDDVAAGRWRALQAPEWSRQYVAELEERARKQLTIWPYHVQIGSPGHGLDPELWSAVFWHSIARRTEPVWMAKGSEPLTEHYSIVQPEVAPVDGRATLRDEGFLAGLAAADQIFVAGEASSHCVLETMQDIVDEFQDHPGFLERVVLLTDCTSPVVHPEIDFGAMAEARFRGFEDLGLQLRASTEARFV